MWIVCVNVCVFCVLRVAASDTERNTKMRQALLRAHKEGHITSTYQHSAYGVGMFVCVWLLCVWCIGYTSISQQSGSLSEMRCRERRVTCAKVDGSPRGRLSALLRHGLGLWMNFVVQYRLCLSSICMLYVHLDKYRHFDSRQKQPRVPRPTDWTD